MTWAAYNNRSSVLQNALKPIKSGSVYCRSY